MKSYPKVTVIFPNFNGGKEPLDCLRSIKNLNYPKNKIGVIVIDNNSTDGSDKQIKKRFPKVILIKNQINLGFAKAINQGINQASGDYIFVANDDLVFEKNSLKNLIDFSLKNPRIGVLGGKIFFKTLKNKHSFSANKHSFSANKISSSGYMMNRWTGEVQLASKPNKIKEPDWIQGCAMLIPRKVFKKIGLLDENYTHLFEDYDFCLRARLAGYKIVYIPNAKFWHGESLTADKNKSLKYFHWYRNKIRFILKNYPIINIISILLFQTLLVTPYRAIFLRDGRLLPFLKGLIWNIKNFKNTLRTKNMLKASFEITHR